MKKWIIILTVILWKGVVSSYADFIEDSEPPQGTGSLTVTARESAENEWDLLQSMVKDGEAGVVLDDNPTLRRRQLERLCSQQDLFTSADFMALFGTHLMTSCVDVISCEEEGPLAPSSNTSP